MPRAIWKDEVIAEADPGDVEIVEGNVYFHRDAVKLHLLIASDTRTSCHWKGTASYYHVVVGGETNQDAAWYYPEPKAAAQQIAERVAFWKGVRVER